MKTEAEHISPDGLLRFIVERDNGDVSLGFAGYGWHTHADLIAASFGMPEREAVSRFVDDLLADRSVIAVSRVGGIIQDVWITDDPTSELRYKPEGEEIEFRYWSGRRWQAS
jgi:hypothetical protein